MPPLPGSRSVPRSSQSFLSIYSRNCNHPDTIVIARYSEAISDCTFALYHDHRNVKALYRRGTSLAMLGRWNDAISGASLFPFSSLIVTELTKELGKI